jgi:putative heme iron utilization protein
MESKAKTRALEARAFLELNRLGILSTASQSHAGFPFGSIVPYDIDTEGRLVIYISLIAEHYKNLKVEPRSSMLVIDPFGVFDPQSRARATVLTTFEAVPDSEHAGVQKRYEARFPGSINYEIAHNFQFFRSEPVKIRWIGGFGDISWITPADLRLAPHDTVAYHGFEIINHMNEDHRDALLDLLRAHSEVPPDESRVEMVSVTSEGFQIASGSPERQRRVTIGFPNRLQSVGDSRTAMIELLKAARKKNANADKLPG